MQALYCKAEQRVVPTHCACCAAVSSHAATATSSGPGAPTGMGVNGTGVVLAFGGLPQMHLI